MLTYGALFAGYGGLEMGVQSVLSGELSWYAEWDKAPAAIMAHHHPDVPNLRDVTKVDWATVPKVDVITGGFPCQDLSHAGKRLGLANGARSSLFHEMLRAVAVIHPSLVVIENVRGLLSGKDTVSEPNDQCVCGWPYRRGRLHRDYSEQGSHLRGDGLHRDEREGAVSAVGHAGDLRRKDAMLSASDGEVGRTSCADFLGFGGSCAPQGHQPALDSQAGAGANRLESRRDSVSQPNEGMAGRGPRPMRDVEATDARAEREGAFDAATGERHTVCPACGGDLGDGSERSLERSWMGTVLRSLAHIGYDARWYGLRAADVGAAHGRFRIFLFATPADAFGGGWDGWAHEPQRQPFGGVAPAGGGEVAGNVHVPGQLTLLPTPAVNDMGAGKTVDAWDAWTDRMRSEHGNGNGHGKSLEIEALRLLPTPDAYEGSRGGSQHPDKRKAGGHSPYLASVVEWIVPSALLPTPRATRGGSGTETLYGLGAERSDENRTQGQVLLPTPRATHWAKTSDRARQEYGSSDSMQDVVDKQDWRDYEAAIRRQERMLGRLAPPPTETGLKGGQRLSPRFVEWLMGLPDGHVCDVPGVTRNELLKVLGNGVVPPQAAAATRAFLADVAAEMRRSA